MPSKIQNLILALTLILGSAQARKLKGSEICSGATASDHLIPHPTDCHLFYSCSEDGDGGYNAYLFSCPAGLAFDDTINRCEFEEFVPRCKQDSTTAAPTTTTVASTTSTEEKPITTPEPEPTTTSTTQAPETTTEEEPITTPEPEPTTTSTTQTQETTTEEEPITTPEPEPTTTSTTQTQETTTPEEPETTTPEKPEPTTTHAPLTTTTTESPVLESITCEIRRGSLSCDHGKVVKVISAFYGRQDRKTCPHLSIHNTSCYSDRLDYLRSECEGKHSCTFTSNNRFGDPCRMTYKYTEVHYQCV